MTVPRFLFLLSWTTLLGLGAAQAAERGRLDFPTPAGAVKVWYYVPDGLTADAPVLFVMHGVKRNGEDYLDEWTAAAAQARVLLVVPEFSQRDFPGEEGYIYGNTVDAAGNPRPREAWAFTAIEGIFDAVRSRFGNRSPRYHLYGHSAGAQFVHRFVYFMPEARLARAVAANAGWYTLPDPAVEFPHGLKGTVISAAARTQALARPLAILLGDADTDPHHPALRRDAATDVQGVHRFARGQYFFRTAQAAAERERLPFHWTLATAPGVAHSNRDMVRFALPVLFHD